MSLRELAQFTTLNSIERVVFHPFEQESRSVVAVGGANRIELFSFDAAAVPLAECQRLCSAKLNSTLSDLCFLPYEPVNSLLAATDAGALLLFRASDDCLSLTQQGAWTNLHRGPTTSVACCVHTDVIGTAGEDGRITLRHIEKATEAFQVFDGDNACINGITFASSDVVVSCNAVAQLNFWDHRVSLARPSRTMTDDVGTELTCLLQHPTRPMLIVCGSSDGSVAIFDTRMERFPVARNRAHTDAINALQFATFPEYLVSCSSDGTLLVWNSYDATTSDASPSVVDDRSKPNVHVLTTHETPLRTISTHRSLNALICGSDSGALLSFCDYVRI